MTLTASFLEGEGLGIVETEEAEELILVGVDAERVPALAGERRELVDLPASRSVRAAVTAAWICEARSAVCEAEVREAMEEETEERGGGSRCRCGGRNRETERLEENRQHTGCKT